MKYKRSQFNITVSLTHERSLVYNSLSRALALLDSDESRFISKNDIISKSNPEHSSKIDLFLSQGFLVKEDVNEIDVVKNLYQQHRFNSQCVNVIVCPTLSCNFGCDYCFQGSQKSKKIMSKSVQDGVVNLYKRIVSEKKDLSLTQFIWYGGEPLMGKQIIYDIADQLIRISKQNNIQHIATMVSNAYLLNREVAQNLCVRGLRSVQVTLDGSKPFHDSRRHLLSGKDTYDKILSNILEWIDDIPISVQIRVNIDDRNKHDIKNLIDDLVEKGLSNRANFKLYFAPVESMTIGCHSVSDKMMKKIQYGTLEADLYRYAYDNNVTDLPYPPYFLGVCSALRPYDYIVVPNGDIHKCWDTVSFEDKAVGHVQDLDALFEKKNLLHQKWDSFDPFTHNTCLNCKILPNCAGSCAHKFIHASDSIGEASLPCPSLKYSIKEKIILKAEKEGFITKDDYCLDDIKTNPEDICSEVFDKSKYLIHA